MKLNRYKHWMDLPAKGQGHAHLAAGMTQRHHAVLLRFRLLCWDTAINRPDGRLRAARKCPNCPCVEDEFHVMFECPHYADIKAKHFDTEGQLFCDVSEAKLPPVKVAAFLLHVLRPRGRMEQEEEEEVVMEFTDSEPDE